MIRKDVVLDMIERFKGQKRMFETMRHLKITKEELAEIITIFYLKEYYQVEFLESSAYTYVSASVLYQKYKGQAWKKEFLIRKKGYVDNR